ncbi:endonuclease VII domain-containing protein [Rhodanobacter glycinis]|uniref:endonuclease VII domain-containing protein n=1 Tax=Rhodanobacter glycinis TaxID=582702 RepID=UPI003D18A71B
MHSIPTGRRNAATACISLSPNWKLKTMSEATKMCTSCKKDLPVTEFYPHKRAKSGLQPNCRTCARAWHKARPDYVRAKNAAYKAANPTYFRDWQRINKYGVTPEDASAMRASQNGKCPGCLRELSEHKECVDHCHTTGKVRGLLCDDCNVSLGRLRDSAETLRRLANHIEAEDYV